MDPSWASEQLQVIRTLMERSVLYRRALAPLMLTAGGGGLAAAVLGGALGIERPRSISLYWLGMGILIGLSCVLQIRSQALRAAEPFWTNPTRRVATAVLPSILGGLFAGAAAAIAAAPGFTAWLAPLWVMLYGAGLHSAGFFMPRGIRLFGAMLVLLGGSLMLAGAYPGTGWPGQWAHLVMGSCFGVTHLAYGIYLHVTEPSEP